MALQSSGQIALSDIRTELEGSGQISLNDSNVRDLIGKAANAENSLSEYYGASAAASKPNALAIQAREWTGSLGDFNTNYYTAGTSHAYDYVVAGKNNPSQKGWKTTKGKFYFNYNRTDLTGSNNPIYGSSYMNVTTGTIPSSTPANYISRWAFSGTASSGVNNSHIMYMDIYAIRKYPSGVNNTTSSWTLNIDFLPAQIWLYESNNTTTPINPSSTGTIETRFGMGYTTSDKQMIFQVNDYGTQHFILRTRLFARAGLTFGSAFSSGGTTSRSSTSPNGFYINDWVAVPNGQLTMVSGQSSTYNLNHYQAFVDVDGSHTTFTDMNLYTAPNQTVSSATIS